MPNNINSERSLAAQDRLTDRGIGIFLENSEIETLATKNTNQSGQFIADTLAQIYRESPQIRAALNSKVENIDFGSQPLPGQVILGVSPSAVERIISAAKDINKSPGVGM